MGILGSLPRISETKPVKETIERLPEEVSGFDIGLVRDWCECGAG
jgi:hypothetical protein